MRLSATVALFVLFQFPGFCQIEDQILSEKEFIEWVAMYHPIAQQAKLRIQEGESNLLKSRGGFDPYLSGDFDSKDFDEKDYFNIFEGSLKVPTWYGVEIKAGYDDANGEFLNPERTVPSNGLIFGGISVPLGQGLFMDQRRADLQKAKIFQEATEAERQRILNELFFKALQEYWQWYQFWENLRVFEQANDLAQERFEAVRQTFLFGDIPAIDTLESFIQVQNRQMLLNEARLKFQNQGLKLSNFLWFENNIPLELQDDTRPPEWDPSSLDIPIRRGFSDSMLMEIAASHPELRLIENQISSLEVEKKFKSEALKPRVDLNYNALTENTGNALNGFSSQDYKWGLQVSVPLFLRKARGDLQLQKLKIRDTELMQDNKILEIRNRIRAYRNELDVLQGQITLYSQAVANYQSLLDGERQKFNAGESSLFLINSREMSLFQARLKLWELISKFNITRAGLDYARGDLHSLIF